MRNLRYLLTHTRKLAPKPEACWKMSLCAEPNTQLHQIRLHLLFSKHLHKPFQGWFWACIVMVHLVFSTKRRRQMSRSSSLTVQILTIQTAASLISRLNHWKGLLRETVNSLVFVQRAHKPQTYLTYPCWLFSLQPSLFIFPLNSLCIPPQSTFLHLSFPFPYSHPFLVHSRGVAAAPAQLAGQGC